MASPTAPTPTALVLARVWPEPASSAAGSRTLTVIELLTDAGFEVTLASPASRTTWSVIPAGVRAIDVEMNDSRFDQMIARERPDLVIFDRFMTEEQFGWRVEKALPHAIRILDTVDLHFLRRARRHAHENGEEPMDPAVIHPADPDLLREVAAIYRSDLCLVISRAEVEILRDRLNVPEELLHYLPLLPPRRAPGAGDFEVDRAFADRHDFATIGNFRHPPNLDAVRWLHAEIWPEIRRRVPTARLRVYGSYPPTEITGLHDERSGFLVGGRASDALEAVAAARVCLAPLRWGAGLKGKLLDALRTGTPSVTTPVGAEGMHGDGPWAGGIASNTAGIAHTAAELHQNEQAWDEARRRAREILRAEFDPVRAAAHFHERLARLRDRREEGRAANLVGAMLRHHLHRSTEFMGRWIEAKNRLQDGARNENAGGPEEPPAQEKKWRE